MIHVWCTGVLCNVNRPSVAELQITKPTFTQKIWPKLWANAKYWQELGHTCIRHALRSDYIFICITREFMYTWVFHTSYRKSGPRFSAKGPCYLSPWWWSVPPSQRPGCWRFQSLTSDSPTANTTMVAGRCSHNLKRKGESHVDGSRCKPVANYEYI